jgi:hypothetical protein
MRKLLIKFPSRIRISGWDFGSSARAMNQAGGNISTQAELVKVINSTTERKSMSTKTSIKRIALVAVAALGFGMLSVVPSSATVTGLTVSAVDGTSTNSAEPGYVSDSTTAAVLTVNALFADAAFDTVTVTFIQKSVPSGATAVPFAYFLDSTTAVASSTRVDSQTTTTAAYTAQSPKVAGAGVGETNTAALAVDGAKQFRILRTSQTVGYAGAQFAVQLDSATARIAGTYTYTAIVKSYASGASTSPLQTVTQDLSIVVAKTTTAEAAAGGTIDASKTTAYINAGSSMTTASDSAVSVLATASSSNLATIQVKTYTATSLAAPESVTVTLTGAAGLLCDSAGTTCGNNLKIAGDGDDLFYVRANGTAGVSTIVVATTSKTFPAKTVTFYAKSPSTITTTVNKPVIGVAAASTNTDVVRAVAKDANGNPWTGQLYIVASAAADALIAGSATTPTACTYNATYDFHACPLKGTAKGTASVKVMDASLDTDGTIATTDAAVTSNAASVRVSTGTASSVKIAFDKATYAPGEKAFVTVRVLDENGDAMPAGTVTNVFAATPTTNVALGTNSASFGTDIAIEAATDATTFTNAGAQTYIVYMPMAQGDVTITAKGSTGLASAGRVEVSATTTVSDDSVTAAVDAANEATDAANAATDAANAAAEAADAATAAAQDAQAAVAALATQVSSLIAGIKAQITSLTNLVIKIQKKVKA